MSELLCFFFQLIDTQNKMAQPKAATPLRRSKRCRRDPRLAELGELGELAEKTKRLKTHQAPQDQQQQAQKQLPCASCISFVKREQLPYSFVRSLWNPNLTQEANVKSFTFTLDERFYQEPLAVAHCLFTSQAQDLAYVMHAPDTAKMHFYYSFVPCELAWPSKETPVYKEKMPSLQVLEAVRPRAPVEQYLNFIRKNAEQSNSSDQSFHVVSANELAFLHIQDYPNEKAVPEFITNVKKLPHGAALLKNPSWSFFSSVSSLIAKRAASGDPSRVFESSRGLHFSFAPPPQVLSLECIATEMVGSHDCPCYCFGYAEHKKPGVTLQTLQCGFSSCTDVCFMLDLLDANEGRELELNHVIFERAKAQRVSSGVAFRRCPQPFPLQVWLDSQLSDYKLHQAELNHQATRTELFASRLEREQLEASATQTVSKLEQELQEAQREVHHLLTTGDILASVKKRQTQQLPQTMWEILRAMNRRRTSITTTAHYLDHERDWDADRVDPFDPQPNGHVSYPWGVRQSVEVDFSILYFAGLLAVHFATRLSDLSVKTDGKEPRSCVVCFNLLSDASVVISRPGCSVLGCHALMCLDCFFCLPSPNQCPVCSRQAVRTCAEADCASARLYVTADTVQCGTCRKRLCMFEQN
jgi:hypothetical protein